jgi:hypothetical protein
MALKFSNSFQQIRFLFYPTRLVTPFSTQSMPLRYSVSVMFFLMRTLVLHLVHLYSSAVFKVIIKGLTVQFPGKRVLCFTANTFVMCKNIGKYGDDKMASVVKAKAWDVKITI